MADPATAGRVLEQMPDGAQRIQVLTENFEAPNPDDSFRSLLEQVLEDVIVAGLGRLSWIWWRGGGCRLTAKVTEFAEKALNHRGHKGSRRKPAGHRSYLFLCGRWMGRRFGS